MKYTLTHLLPILLVALCSFPGLAAPAGTYRGLQKTSLVSFIENKGQVMDQYQAPRQDIQYTLKATDGLSIFIGNGAIHYQFSKSTASQAQPPANDIVQKHVLPQPASFDMYRMDVTLVGANKNATVIAEQLQAYQERYSVPATSANGAMAHAYNKITYKDIYPGIDWVLYTGNGRLEHEFVVRQGGKISDIQLKYGGAATLGINADGSLTATTPMGTITEQAPHTYLANGQVVASAFVLQGNVLGYTTGPYSGDLVIDPALTWSTYLGGSAEDFSFAIATDKHHRIYTTGWTASIASIVTSGAYQGTYGGGVYDAFLAKFNSDGTPMWITYYGGELYDVGLAVTTDTMGNVFMSGCTKSLSGIATPGAYQISPGGGYDAFLAKFDSMGVRQWGTYYGGSNWEEGLSVKTDKTGNVFMAGETQSATGIATPGAYQTLTGGSWDATLAKFDGAGNIQWSTYFGGTEEDVAYALAMDTLENVYMTGYTASSNAIATTGAYQATYGGGPYDAFLARVSSAGMVQWSTYYGGSGNDQAFTVALDTSGHIFMAGMTSSSSAIATPGSYQATYGGGSNDAFLVQLSTSGVRQWATYYGGPDFDLAYGVAQDGAGSLYLTGATASTAGIATPGAYQTAFGGGFDVFLAQFSVVGAMQWASYYGGNVNDIATGIATADSGRVYITGYTASTSAVATAGAYQTTYGGAGYDGFLAKFNFCEVPAVAQPAGPATVCPGHTIVLTDATPGGVWLSTDVTVATISGTGLLTGMAAGTATISYTVSTVCGDSTVTYTVTVPGDTACNTGMHTTAGKGSNELTIVPNPAHGTFTVTIAAATDEQATIVLTNMLGVKVGEVTTVTNKATALQLNEPAGIYMLTTATRSGVHVAKVIIN